MNDGPKYDATEVVPSICGFAGLAHVGRPCAVHVLGRDMAFEDVLEVGWQRAVNVEEVRHVDDVVDDLAAVDLTTVVYQCQSVHSSLVAPSIRGMVTSGGGGLRSGSFQTNSIPSCSSVVHVAVRAEPGHPLAVRHLLAPAVPAPAPVVERARDLVALHLALGEVAAHVPAVAVEHVDPAVATAEDHQLLPERVDRVRLAVAEIPGQPQAVPATGESGRGRFRFDLPNLVGVGLQRHDLVLQPPARLRSRSSRWQGKSPLDGRFGGLLS